MSMSASLTSIIYNVEVGNGFIHLTPGVNITTMVINGMKMMPMIFISTTFRTFSLVLMSSYLRQYAVIPILVMIIIQTIMTRWILRDTKNLADFLLSFAPYAIISLVSCPILPPSGNENEEHDGLGGYRHNAG